MRQKKLSMLAAAMGLLLVTGCGSKMGPLGADNFTLTPLPLEETGGEVTFTLHGRFPEKYMNRKAQLTITPELRYAGKVRPTASARFQGETVVGNDQQVSYRLGGNFTLRGKLPYEKAMDDSRLYLTFSGKLGKKALQIPDVEVGYGVLSTSTLAARAAMSAHPAVAEDTYQYAIAQRQQAQIHYLIQQTNIRTSELQNTSVQDFLRTLREIKADRASYQIDGIEISSYASPEGNVDLNTRLAQGRGKSSSEFLEGELKEAGLEADISTRYTAEDWEGFQELVAQSNLQDKDVILRVLSMYPDPEERERQIRNLSAAFQELTQEILPELRRSRLTINYQLLGRTDEEIQAQYAENPAKLSVDELLYAAALSYDDAEKRDIYATAARLYPEDYRTHNNVAAMDFAAGRTQEAEASLSRALQLTPDAPEANANRALITMAKEGDSKAVRKEALNYLSRATSSGNYQEVYGIYNILDGNYAQASQNLRGNLSNATLLAQILNRDYVAAAETAEGILSPDATTHYLTAILLTRQQRDDEAVSQLAAAIKADATLRDRARTDVEFHRLAARSDFQKLLAQ